MSLSNLPYNDMMAQCSKRLIKISKEEEEKRIHEIENCNHLFVKIRDYDTSQYDNADLSVVECVRCGVTNKYENLERVMEKYRRSLDYYVLTNFHYTNIEYNDVTIETVMMNKIKAQSSQLNMMSDGIIRSFHPGLLYKLATIIAPAASNDELFNIMLKLDELETFEERNKLDSVFDATDLVERYKKEVKTLRK